MAHPSPRPNCCRTIMWQSSPTPFSEPEPPWASLLRHAGAVDEYDRPRHRGDALDLVRALGANLLVTRWTWRTMGRCGVVPTGQGTAPPPPSWCSPAPTIPGGDRQPDGGTDASTSHRDAGATVQAVETITRAARLVSAESARAAPTRAQQPPTTGRPRANSRY